MATGASEVGGGVTERVLAAACEAAWELRAPLGEDEQAPVHWLDHACEHVLRFARIAAAAQGRARPVGIFAMLTGPPVRAALPGSDPLIGVGGFEGLVRDDARRRVRAEFAWTGDAGGKLPPAGAHVRAIGPEGGRPAELVLRLQDREGRAAPLAGPVLDALARGVEEMLLEPLLRRHALRLRCTPSQRRVLPLLLRGCSEPGIARELGRSPHTVHDHVRSIYKAFGVGSRLDLSRVWEGRPPLNPESGGGRRATEA